MSEQIVLLLQAINRAAAILLTEQDAPKAISAALGIVGEATGVDRVYIFQNVRRPGAELMVSQRYEWACDRVSLQLDNPELQDLPYETAGLSRWRDVMKAGGVIKGYVRDFPASEQALLNPQEILSLICLPIFIEDEFWGFVGFDDCTRERAWGQQEEQVLSNLATALGGAIMRQRYDRSILRYQEELEEAQRIAGMGNFEYDYRRQEVRLSPEVLRLHGLSRQADFPQGEVPVWYPEPYRTRMVELSARCLIDGTPYDEIFLLQLPGQPDKWVRMICHPIRQEGEIYKLKGVVIDVTAAETARRRLADLSQRLLLAGQAGHIGFWAWDFGQDRVTWDRTVGQWIGTPANETGVPSAQLLNYFHPEVHTQVWREITSSLKSQADHAVFETQMGSEATGWKTVLSRAYIQRLPSGQAARMIGVILDVTEDRRIRQELIRAKEQAEQAAQAKTEFLSVMSHEIRTPLNAVIGYAHLLGSEQPRADQVEYIDSLRISSENLLSLINDILDYSKIEAGMIELERREVHLDRLVQGILKTHQFRAEERQVRLEALIDPRLPTKVLADPVRLGQILSNLIGNAVKFTEKGEVTVRLTLARAGRHDTSVCFEVADTGIGIDPSLHKAIFDRFTQADSSTNRRFGGTGLGLTITQQLIALMGGEIRLSSSLGQGATFRFELAFAHPERTAEAVPATAGPGLPATTTLAGLRVLVVEDNAINRKIMGRFLAKWQVSQTDFAEDGQAGVEAARQGAYDVILMDLQMPVMNGLEAALAIRAAGIATPIIALTADAMPDVRARIQAAGMDDLTTKPFHPEQLFTKLARYLPALRPEVKE